MRFCIVQKDAEEIKIKMYKEDLPYILIILGSVPFIFFSFLKLFNYQEFFQIEIIRAIVPYYYFPTIKNLQKQSLYIGKNAYQLLYFGQYEDSLNLAKLAVKINTEDEKLWLILAEAQIANKEYQNALSSLNKAEQINSNISEIYFAKRIVFLKISQQSKAKNALEKGIKIEPNNH